MFKSQRRANGNGKSNRYSTNGISHTFSIVFNRTYFSVRQAPGKICSHPASYSAYRSYGSCFGSLPTMAPVTYRSVLFFSTKSPRPWMPAWRGRCTIIWSRNTSPSSVLAIESLCASTISANSNCIPTGNSTSRIFHRNSTWFDWRGRKARYFVHAMIFSILFINKDVCCVSIDARSRTSRQPTDSCFSFVRHTFHGLTSHLRICCCSYLFLFVLVLRTERKRMNDCATCLSPFSFHLSCHVLTFQPALSERKGRLRMATCVSLRPPIGWPFCTSFTFSDRLFQIRSVDFETPPIANMTMESKLPTDVDVSATEPSMVISLTTNESTDLNERIKTEFMAYCSSFIQDDEEAHQCVQIVWKKYLQSVGDVAMVNRSINRYLRAVSSRHF